MFTLVYLDQSKDNREAPDYRWFEDPEGNPVTNTVYSDSIQVILDRAEITKQTIIKRFGINPDDCFMFDIMKNKEIVGYVRLSRLRQTVEYSVKRS